MIAAIGDIHGELGMLDALLAKLESRLDPNGTILFIGDYIDRGPDSRGVIERIMNLRLKRPVITLRGNHEQLMLDSYLYFTQERGSRGDNWERGILWFQNNAHTTIESYPKGNAKNWWERIPDDHIRFVQDTIIEYQAGNYLFVHAGLLPRGAKWEEHDLDPRLWVRDPFLHSSQDFGKVVVFGHTPLKRPLFMANKRKVFEIYDRLAYAAVGQQSDIEALRVAAVDFAHQEGFNRSEQDVTIQRVVTALSGPVKKAFADFSSAPFVVRSLFAQVAATPDRDTYAVLEFDGDFTIHKNHAFVSAVAGEGDEALDVKLEEAFSQPVSLKKAEKALREILQSTREEKAEEGFAAEMVLLERSEARENRFRILEGE